MTEARQLSAALQRYAASDRNGWFCPLPQAVEGLTAGQAAQVPGPGLNSIWALVNHIRFEHECIISRLHGLLAHTAYHVGQIVLLRRIQTDWEALRWLPK